MATHSAAASSVTIACNYTKVVQIFISLAFVAPPDPERLLILLKLFLCGE